MNSVAEKQEVSVVGLGIDDVMGSAKQKEPSKGKSKTPILKADVKLMSLADRVYEAKKALEMAENEFRQSSLELIEAVSPQRTVMCQKEYVSSVKVPTNKGMLVGVSWSTNYKKIPPDQEKNIMEIMGSEYQNCFEKKYVISAKDKDKSEFEKLIYSWLAPNGGETEEDVAIGIARFKSFFEVEILIRPTEQFTRNHMFMSEQKRNELELCGVQKNQPSIKTR